MSDSPAQIHLGYSFVDVEVPRFGFRTQQFVLTRPTDEGALELTLGIRVRPLADPTKGSLRSRLSHQGLGEILALLIFQGFKADVRQDIPVWNRKLFLAQPALAEGDGPIGAYRRWARQFYGEAHLTAS